jgi:decaprenyl-phosphate phosphoribosyltransferase
MFAVERANMDLVIFALLGLAAVVWRSRAPAAHIVSPLLVLAAAVGKIYPAIALAAFLISGSRRAAATALAGGAVFFGYAIVTSDDIAAVARTAPQGEQYSFGARILLARAYHVVSANSAQWAPAAAQLVAAGAVLVLAWLVWRRARRLSLGATRGTRGTRGDSVVPARLLAFYFGALLYLGCFALVNSYDYRLVFLLLAMPQLFAWVNGGGPAARLAAIGVVVVLLQLWVSALSGPLYLADELVSWALAGLLLALLVAGLRWPGVDGRQPAGSGPRRAEEGDGSMARLATSSAAPPSPALAPGASDAETGERARQVGRAGVAGALLRTMRPRQWTKNLLVFGAPITAGVLAQPDVAVQASLAFVALCLASSGVYIVNDLVDQAGDRIHPVKRRRPIASGALPVPIARLAAALLIAAGLGLAVATRPALALVVAGYVGLALSYTFVLREIVLLDIAAVAGGFLLRAVAGGAAVYVPLSSWFLIVAAFGSLFLVAGKRHADYLQLGDNRGAHRRTLAEYSPEFLSYIQYSASTIAIAAYCLWAFESPTSRPPWSGLSILPFVLAIFRYALLVDHGGGGSPEEIVLRDRWLLAFGAAWIALVATGVYA